MNGVLPPAPERAGLGAAPAPTSARVRTIVTLSSHRSGYGFDPQVIVAAAAAAWLFYTRFKVTPVADPRDGNGQPLISPDSAIGEIMAARGEKPPAPPSNVTVVPGQPAPPPANGPRM